MTTTTTPAIWMTEDEAGKFELDVSRCPDCEALGGDEVCPDHDLDDPEVTARYSAYARGEFDDDE